MKGFMRDSQPWQSKSILEKKVDYLGGASYMCYPYPLLTKHITVGISLSLLIHNWSLNESFSVKILDYIS